MPDNKGGNSHFGGRVPVVLFIHKRTRHLRRVLKAVRSYRPQRIFVFADGWNSGDGKEEAACQKARELVGRAVNWPCRRSLVFSRRKLGLKTSVERGLGHVFGKVREAIILEDDCVATPEFFKFCEDNLRKYRRDSMVMSISGSCFVKQSVPIPGCAYLSRYPHCWGWATWRRAWKKYRGLVNPENLRRILDRQDFPSEEKRHWGRVTRELAQGRMSSWAYYWIWAHWRLCARSLIPAVNLVTNIGFDSTARHTRELSKPLAVRRGKPGSVMKGPVLSPVQSEVLDRSVFRNHYQRMSGRRGWWQKIADRWCRWAGLSQKP